MLRGEMAQATPGVSWYGLGAACRGKRGRINRRYGLFLTCSRKNCYCSLVSTATLPSPADRLMGITEGLFQVVAALSYRGQLEGRLILLICTRLRRLGARFVGIVERVRAGTLPRTAPVRPIVRPTVRPSGDRAIASRPIAPRPGSLDPALIAGCSLPTGFAWLIRLGGYKAVAYGSHLEHLLADPEMAALIASAPQLGRVLRPLCRMLGVDPGPARLPPRPRDPEAPRPRTPGRKQASPRAAARRERLLSTAAGSTTADDEARAAHYPVSLWLRRA